MRSRRKSLLALAALAALSSAVIYSACFKPELALEAFRCNEPPHECPEGYYCHPLTLDDRRCFKEGHEPPVLDSGPPKDMKPSGDGPHQDGPSSDAGLKLTCTGPEVVVSTDLMGAALAVSKQGEPVLLYRNASGIYHKNRKGSIWSTPNQVTTKPTNFAAAIDDQDRINVIYTNAAATTMYHCIKAIQSTTCMFEKEFAKADLANIKDVTSFAIASNTGRTFAAIGLVDKLDKHKGVLIEAKPVGSPVINDISYTKFQCDQDTTIGDPVLHEAALAVGPDHVVASYWLSATASQFRVFSYPLNLKACAEGKNNPLLLETNNPLRMPVVITRSGGVIHTAHGNFGANQGRVHHYEWPFASPNSMVPAQQSEVWSPTTAKPESVDLALSGDRPVVSLTTNVTGKRRPVLLLSDSTAAGGWMEIKLPGMLKDQIAGDQTRVAVSDGRIHLAFEGEHKGKPSLFYIGCEGDLPK